MRDQKKKPNKKNCDFSFVTILQKKKEKSQLLFLHGHDTFRFFVA